MGLYKTFFLGCYVIHGLYTKGYEDDFDDEKRWVKGRWGEKMVGMIGKGKEEGLNKWTF